MMRTIRLASFMVVVLGAFALSVQGQTDCPPDKVCLTQAQAAKYLTLEDTVKAQQNEILALKQAVLDQKLVTMDVKIELARTVGELTGAKQALVRCDVDKDLLVKYGRVRKLGLINF